MSNLQKDIKPEDQRRQDDQRKQDDLRRQDDQRKAGEKIQEKPSDAARWDDKRAGDKLNQQPGDAARLDAEKRGDKPLDKASDLSKDKTVEQRQADEARLGKDRKDQAFNPADKAHQDVRKADQNLGQKEVRGEEKKFAEQEKIGAMPKTK